ncbi:MAG TPA: SIMPL domain-containing protein [Gemmataceae bacterium]|nr:SIMPL domain-containing protein [Gemmataceae bacterium]
MKHTLATLVAFAFAGTASAQITVTGTGKVTYVPNMAHVNVSVSSDAKTAAEAWQKNAEIVRKLFSVLKDFHVDEKDFKTTGLHVNPRYVHRKDQEPQLVGYTVAYDLTVTVRQLDRLGALLDQLVANGANRGMGIGFSIANPEELLEQARLRAVADARKRAELYAKGAGTKVGHVLRIDEGQAPMPRFVRLEAATPGAADALMLAAGQQELTASVTVSYAVTNN